MLATGMPGLWTGKREIHENTGKNISENAFSSGMDDLKVSCSLPAGRQAVGRLDPESGDFNPDYS
ncbi:MAG TPA: hypothetical protein VN328_09815 [Thermodesulfovibrionales bacterium]|nr:hypothetical protein [Thermodesulfovibrionales bacterium]